MAHRLTGVTVTYSQSTSDGIGFLLVEAEKDVSQGLVRLQDAPSFFLTNIKSTIHCRE